ncbi:MAG: recombinase family protein, partial [Bacteroidia bacterium]
MMITPKSIATYSRVSTAKQEDEQTIKNQLASLNEYALKNNLTIVKNYSDEGWSGDILARPALDQLRQDVKAKIWSAVLIYDPDRLARRYSYQELVMDELKEGGIEVMFITVSTPKNSEDKILHGVRGLFAEYERAKISERFRLGKLRKLREGHILVTEALYGYTYIPKKDKVHGYYEINENEARVVKLIYSWIDKEGLTLRKVVRRLQEYGIRPRKSKRGVWNTSTLSTMLKNKSYIGEAHWWASYAVVPEKPLKIERYKKMKKSSRRIRPESEWFIVPVPSIIERDQFERVQNRLKRNFELCIRNKKNQYLFAGKIWCTCGKRRAGEGPQNGKHLYYRCSSRVAAFPLKAECREKGINARIVDAILWEKISALMSSPELMHTQVKN